MIRAIPPGILRQVLLVMVGSEVFFCKEIAWLRPRGHSTGRLSVDVDVDPPVDLIGTSIQSPVAGKLHGWELYGARSTLRLLVEMQFLTEIATTFCAALTDDAVQPPLRRAPPVGD
jgi:hypothetical protein